MNRTPSCFPRHHLLDHHRHADVGRVNLLAGAVGDRALVPQAGPAGSHGGQQPRFANDIEIRVLLPRETGRREVLGSRRRSDRDWRICLSRDFTIGTQHSVGDVVGNLACLEPRSETRCACFDLIRQPVRRDEITVGGRGNDISRWHWKAARISRLSPAALPPATSADAAGDASGRTFSMSGVCEYMPEPSFAATLRSWAARVISGSTNACIRVSLERQAASQARLAEASPCSDPQTAICTRESSPSLARMCAT